jgi:hypothetical protein
MFWTVIGFMSLVVVVGRVSPVRRLHARRDR